MTEGTIVTTAPSVITASIIMTATIASIIMQDMLIVIIASTIAMIMAAMTIAGTHLQAMVCGITSRPITRLVIPIETSAG